MKIRALAPVFLLAAFALATPLLVGPKNTDFDKAYYERHLRSSNWYRRRLGRHFIPVGGGLFVSRRSSTVLWELEKLEARPRSRAPR